MLDTGGKQLLATLRGQTEIQTGDHVAIKVNPECDCSTQLVWLFRKNHYG